ncbi:formylglycine-generating enzyme [Candidatus Magnetomoraceae bacterium gMMP-1]
MLKLIKIILLVLIILTLTYILSPRQKNHVIIKNNKNFIKKADLKQPDLINKPDIERETWTEPVTKMEFIKIPAGCFNIGSPIHEKGRNPDEGPIHEICLDDFFMGKYEVTKGQFRIFIENTKYKTDAEKEGFSWVYRGEWKKREGYDWLKAGFDQDDNHPVVNISWNDACAMAEWMSAFGKKFRLPTEQEWEYACRAGSITARYWGDIPDSACLYANIADQTVKKYFPAWKIHPCNDGYLHTSPTGSFESNGFGLYDIMGNVWEWCLNKYDRDAYKTTQLTHLVYKKSSPVAIRGGSWYSRPAFVRSASRDRLSGTNRRGHDLGFRLILEQD